MLEFTVVWTEEVLFVFATLSGKFFHCRIDQSVKRGVLGSSTESISLAWEELLHAFRFAEFDC